MYLLYKWPFIWYFCNLMEHGKTVTRVDEIMKYFGNKFYIFRVGKISVGMFSKTVQHLFKCFVLLPFYFVYIILFNSLKHSRPHLGTVL